jgi:hypothetical protein
LQVLCRLQLVRDYSKCFAVYLPFVIKSTKRWNTIFVDCHRPFQ